MKSMAQQSWTRFLASGAALTLASLAFAACSTTNAAEPERPARAVAAQSVQVATARTGQLAQTLTYTGDVKSRTQVALTPKMAGRVEELRVEVGTEVTPGTVIAVLEHEALDAQVRQAEAALRAAQAKLATVEAGGRSETILQAGANYDAAKQRLAAMTQGPRSEVVAQAAAGVRAAEARLQQLKAGPTVEQQRVAQMNVEGAKVRLHGANVQKDGDCNPARPEYLCNAAQANAFAAAYAVDAAQAQYDALLAPPTSEQLAQAQAALDAAREQLRFAQRPHTEHDVAQAEDAVKAAEQQVELARRPFTVHDLAAAKAGVEQAAVAVELARLALKDSTVVAPIAGVIAERLANLGSLASPQSPIVTIVDRDVEILVQVEESKIGALAVGRSATLVASSRPDRPIPAVVASVAPTVDSRTRTIATKIAPTVGDAQLKPGMFVQATIALEERQGALLVPKEAVVQRDGKQVVFSLSGDTVRLTPVRVGSSGNGREVEILEGLANGDEVIVGGQANLIDGTAVAVAGR